jgi:uncharacterized membrane protein YfcA
VDIGWPAFLLVFGFGVLSGVLASLVGIGGAVITTPLIRLLGATPIAAVGSTVPAILPGALSGSLRYQREGYIDWRAVRSCAPGGVGAAILGAWVADLVDAGWLMVVTAVLVLWSGWRLLAGARPTEENDGEPDSGQGSSERTPPWIFAALGVAAGFLAGLLGVGGGIILTPGLTLYGGLRVKHAVATSLATVAFMSVSALVTHVALGHIDWRFATPLAIGIVPGARLGASITIGASERRMRVLAGSLLLVIAVVYLVRELSSLLA